MSGPLDFLEGESAPPVETVAPEPAQVAPAPQRGPDGRFAPAQPAEAPAAAPTEQPAPVEEAPKTAEPGHVPISAMLDEREKRQAAERRLAEMEARQQPANPPPELDPDTENALLQLRLNTSEELVRDKEGDEVVDAAKAWAIEKFRTNPAYQAEVLGKPNPYKFVVAEHKAHLKLEAAKDLDLSDLDAFKAWKAAGGVTPANPAPTPAPLQSPPPPPRSLASAPSAGHAVDTRPQGPGEAFNKLFSG